MKWVLIPIFVFMMEGVEQPRGMAEVAVFDSKAACVEFRQTMIETYLPMYGNGTPMHLVSDGFFLLGRGPDGSTQFWEYRSLPRFAEHMRLPVAMVREFFESTENTGPADDERIRKWILDQFAAPRLLRADCLPKHS